MSRRLNFNVHAMERASRSRPSQVRELAGHLATKVDDWSLLIPVGAVAIVITLAIWWSP